MESTRDGPEGPSHEPAALALRPSPARAVYRLRAMRTPLSARSPASPARTAPISPSCCSRRATRSTAWCAAPRPRSSSASSTSATASRCTRATCSTSARSSTRCAPRTRRDLQPRGDVVRRRLLDPADPDGRVHRHRRHADARGDARSLPRGALLPGLLERDVRQGARGAADRDDALLSALALRRGEGLRPLHHGQLPRVLRPARDLRDPLQPRESRAAGWSS